MDVPSKAMPDPTGTVSEDVKPQQTDGSEPVKTQKPEAKGAEAPEPTATPKGDATPENRSYAALAEERALRREAEVRAAELEAQLRIAKASPSKVDEENLSEEGVTLSRQIRSLETELVTLKENQAKEQLVALNPALKDSLPEFDEFRRSYPGVAMEKVARLFLSEKGIGTAEPQRKGLERPSGGAKSAPAATALSEDDVKRLRETQPRKYIAMLRSGALNPDIIHTP